MITSAEIEDTVTARSHGFAMPSGLVERLTGVRERRHVQPGIASSDLAAQAGLAALAKADVDPLSVDLLIYSSASHDVSEPATSAIVQHKMGARNATFADIKNACNSFLNGLDFAAASIATGRARRVLVVAGEVLSPTINWEIESSVELRTKLAALTLGDAGGAVLLEATDEENTGLLPGRFVSDGSQWELSTVMSGGNLMVRDNSRSYFECDSSALQKLAIEHIPPLIEKTVAEVGWNLDEITRIFPHQVSKGVTQALCSAIGYDQNQVTVTLDRFGNNAAASIPLALSLASEQGHLNKGDKVLLVCGAAGFTAGVMPVIW
ncbi:3-oxoacyl-ACP synthase III family protein [Kineosporia succinea]|uniref:3-oxoacyl-[acyl-carrier-protein] synthase-3 n=1 Tax=Kineosporia succinea TaxID=84632 RepID=A0ABT9NXA6_9ACTN|nr:ketoacyl-ACP synthase III [Kineosporia succinea]MDP9825055.1 3-oxoacyl-[acyl-carrier-protein] synthase-3 [Kineosporia succinea]